MIYLPKYKQSTICLLTILFFVSPFLVCAQKSTIKYYKQLGEQLLIDREYEEAKVALLIYQKESPKEAEVLLNLAICSYYLNEIEKLEHYLNRYEQLSPQKSSTYTFYKARLLYKTANYEAAILAYKTYLRSEKEQLNRRKQAKQELRQCGIAIAFEHYSFPFDLIAHSKNINSEFQEERPIPSPNYEHSFYFSSNRRGNMDVFFVENDTSITETLDRNINTGTNEQLLAFGNKGQWMYFKRDDDFWVDSFSNIYASEIILPPFVENTFPVFFSDSVLLFSSNQIEGYGGYDLYFCRLFKDGWSSPKNLGSSINTANDERSPFLDSDGRTLYFSSNDPTISIGGYDIFRSIFDLESEDWKAIENLGTIINSPANELDFTLNKEGTKAYFTSDSWKGRGKTDIYCIAWRTAVKRMNDAFLFDDVIAFKQAKILNTFSPPSKEEFYYRVQLFEDTKADKEIPNYLSNPHIQFDETRKKYRYLFGRYQSFESAKQWCKEVEKKDWKSAKVIAYYGDKALTLSEIETYKTQYEDFLFYLDYLQKLE